MVSLNPVGPKIVEGSADNFSQFQKDHFEEAERKRYRWQTGNPIIRKYEGILLADLEAMLQTGHKVLEVGCGEGANFTNLRGSHHLKLVIGVDFSQDKSQFWLDNTRQTNVAQAYGGLCADATRLPLADHSFDLVFCRDVLHHIAPDQKARVLKEMFRVCRPGGRVMLIESNGRNPVIFIHALLIKAERGEWKSSPTLFKQLLLNAGAKTMSLKGCEPLPVFRLILHYRFGIPALSRYSITDKAINILDKVFSQVLPQSFWAYVIAWADVPG